MTAHYSRTTPPGQEEPTFKVPFSSRDHQVLQERAGTAGAQRFTSRGPEHQSSEELGVTDSAPRHTGAVLDLLETAASAHGRTDAAVLTPQEVLSALRALEVARRHIDALNTDLLAQFDRTGTTADHGYRTTEALLQGEFRITGHEARRRTALSRLLGERISLLGEKQEPAHPAIAGNYAEGRISADEARVLCNAVEDLPPAVKNKYGEQVESTLVELAPTVSLTDIPKLAGRIVQIVDPDGTPPQFEPEPHKYHLTLNQKVNGDWRVTGLLDCPTGTTLHSLLYARMKDTAAPVTIGPRSSGSRDDGDSTAGSSCGDNTPAEATKDTSSTAEDSPTGPREGTRGHQALPVPPDEQRQPETPAPHEAVWERTDITVDADGRTLIDGPMPGEGTLMPEDAGYLMGEDGWPVPISDRVSEAVLRLHQEAQDAQNGTAVDTLWEKTPGRTAGAIALTEDNVRTQDAIRTENDIGTDNDISTDNGDRTVNLIRREDIFLDANGSPTGTDSTPGTGSPIGDEHLPPGDAGLSLPADDEAARPVTVGHRSPGVLESGARSTLTPEPDSHSPGIQRHDRLAFLLRCLSRERVLHGADHALVVSARADDLAHPHRPLSTQAGGPTTLNQLEKWSRAAQLFAHITDEGGRTLAVRSQGRFATRTQMAVLTARDQGCTFPDCDAPAGWCEAHHIVPHAEGGPTHLDNLTLACPFHHRWFERSGWTSIFHRGLPAWIPPARIDTSRTPVFHSRFRTTLLRLPPFLGTSS